MQGEGDEQADAHTPLAGQKQHASGLKITMLPRGSEVS